MKPGKVRVGDLVYIEDQHRASWANGLYEIVQIEDHISIPVFARRVGTSDCPTRFCYEDVARFATKLEKLLAGVE